MRCHLGWLLLLVFNQSPADLFQVHEIEIVPTVKKEHLDYSRRDHEYTKTRETDGVACDAQGNLFFLNYTGRNTVTIEKLTLAGEIDSYLDLPRNVEASGLCFDRTGNLYLSDIAGRRILRIDAVTKEMTTFAHDERMNFLREMAITADGTLFVSDPNFRKRTGQIWRIDPHGRATCAASGLGTTTGIEVSPDGKKLYVCESEQRNLWVFKIGDDGTLSQKRLVKEFPCDGLFAIRCDVDGNLYLTALESKVAYQVSPSGQILREINVLRGSQALCFGGSDGRTVYVTQARQMVKFRVDRPGLAWQRWQK